MAIKTETVTINGKQLRRTVSDANKYIMRGGMKYAEAVDPLDTDREYTETDETIPDLGKFTPSADESGADGTEANPYDFTPGQTLVPNAFYRSPELFVYMPADAEPKAYDTWADAVADMAKWD